MAFPNASLAIFLLSLPVAVQMIDARPAAGRSLLATIDCESACQARCRLTKRPNLCKRACGSCCYTCNCVPPGTAGNEDVCPCYAKLTTHGGRHKCP